MPLAPFASSRKPQPKAPADRDTCIREEIALVARGFREESSPAPLLLLPGEARKSQPGGMAMDGELETTIFVCMRPGLEGLAASYDFSGYLEPKEKLMHVSDFWNGWTDDDDEKEPCLVLAPVEFCALRATPVWEAFLTPFCSTSTFQRPVK